MIPRSVWYASVVIILTGVLGGCAATSSTNLQSGSTVAASDRARALTPADLAKAGGPVHVAGSSTVYPLTEAVVVAFNTAGAPAQFSVSSIGTTAGFRSFCNGMDVDIVDASRPITAEEQATCTAGGRPAVPFEVGKDALAVVVSTENTFLDALTLEQLATIYMGKALTWADVDRRYPAEPIRLYSPGTDSGTFDYFAEQILGGDSGALSKAATLSENDNELVDGVKRSPYAIAYFGYAYYQENSDTLRAIPIVGANAKPITPSADTVADGSYPLARPLFIYSSPAILKAKPHVAIFIHYYLDTVNTLIGDVGYFPTSANAATAAREQLVAAVR